MSNHYRLNVRFDLDDKAEHRAAKYLTELNNEKGRSRNRFIVEAVLSFMERQNSERDFTLEDIRQVLREELAEVSFAAPTPAEPKQAATELTAKQKAENDENVLADLAAFF